MQKLTRIGWRRQLPFMVLSVMGLLILTLTVTMPSPVQSQEEQREMGAMGTMGSMQSEDRPETGVQSPITLNPAAGSEMGQVYEAFLSPQQEGGEEEETPALIPPQFRSTAPSVPRNQRTSRGHAAIQFTKDLSRAYVYMAVENVNPDDVVMLHLHCGRPGQLGPILIDFAMAGNLQTYLADGIMQVEVTNEDIVAVASHVSSPIDAFTSGCPIVPEFPNDKVKTIAGMALIASQGELYFNLHTKGQVYFGDIRGQFGPVLTSENS